MVGTDELKNTAGFKLRGWPRPHLRLSPQFQFFPAIAMKLLTKWCFLNLINMILKVAEILSSLLTPADTQKCPRPFFLAHLCAFIVRQM